MEIKKRKSRFEARIRLKNLFCPICLADDELTMTLSESREERWAN